MESVLSRPPRLKLEKRKGMHSPSIRNRRESCFILVPRNQRGEVVFLDVSLPILSLSSLFLLSPLLPLSFFHFSIDHCRRGGCEGRAGRMLWPEIRFVPCWERSLFLFLSSRSITFLDRPAGSTDVYLDVAIIGLVFLSRVSRLVWLTRAMAFEQEVTKRLEFEREEFFLNILIK